MARPKSDDKRDALLAAASRVIAAQGLSAPTAVIAREAGVSSGSLFTYFETKAELYNQLYLELKARMATVSLEGRPAQSPPREQFLRMWRNWTSWAASNPDQRRALALLDVSDDITDQTRTAAHAAMADIAALIEQARARGPMREAPMEFVVALVSSLAETTMDFMVNDPARADDHCQAGFAALGRMLGDSRQTTKEQA